MRKEYDFKLKIPFLLKYYPYIVGFIIGFTFVMILMILENKNAI